ncbi:MAG: hypothetical protein WD359_08985, partial [Dehalococcoidia bacterium]
RRAARRGEAPDEHRHAIDVRKADHARRVRADDARGRWHALASGDDAWHAFEPDLHSTRDAAFGGDAIADGRLDACAHDIDQQARHDEARDGVAQPPVKSAGAKSPGGGGGGGG